MAWYYGTFACGCEGRTNVVGPSKSRQWIIDRNFEKLCPECWEKKLIEDREKANAEAAEKAKEMELPELTGTEKQVTWANTLRQKLIDEIDEYNDRDLRYLDTTEKKVLEAVNYMITNKTSASWYIDNRGSSLIVMEKLLKEIITAPKSEEKQLIKDIKAESTIYPDNCQHKESAEIKIDGDFVRVFFPKNDDFKEIVKDLGFEWGIGWQLKKTSTSGKLEDRAAELGNKLLNAGFPICILDSEIRQKAIDGTFEPECKRWILIRSSGDYKGRLTVWWKGQDNKLYNTARKLPNSKYSSPSVVVKVNYYQEVLDFAEMYSFKVSDAALKAIDEYKKSLESVEVVSPVKVEQNQYKDGLADILNSGDDIIADLKD